MRSNWLTLVLIVSLENFDMSIENESSIAISSKNNGFTLTHDSNDLPYFASKASRMSPKSISDRDTMILIKVLSSVPLQMCDKW